MMRLKRSRRLGLSRRNSRVSLKPLVLIWMIVAVTGLGTWLWPNAVQAASVGPRFAAASGDCIQDNSAAGTQSWLSVGNAFSDDGFETEVTVDGTASEYIKCTNFGFTTGMIPTGSTIDGIIVTVERQSSSTANGCCNDAAVRIVKGGTIGTTDRSTATTYTVSMVAENHGGASDLWGETWSVANITASNFGAAFSATKASGGGAAQQVLVDYISITVHYTAPAPVVEQNAYRWRSDDGAENAGTSLVAANTALTTAQKGTKYRLRFTVDNNNGPATGYQYRLQYAPKGASCSTAFYGMMSPDPVTPISFTSTSYYTDGASSTNITTGSGVMSDPAGSTFVAGELVASDDVTTGITLAADQFTEIEYTLQINSSASFNSPYCFRLINNLTPLDTYTVYPELEVPSIPHDITQRQGVITNDQNDTILSGHTAKIGERMRVITQVDTDSGGSVSNLAFKLQYDKNDNTWVDVSPSSEIRPASSTEFNQSKALSPQLPGACNGGALATKGTIYEDVAVSSATSISSSACYSLGFVIDTANAVHNTTYRFRLYNVTDGAVLDTYSAYASFTTVNSANDTIRSSKELSVTSNSSQADLANLLDDMGYNNISTDDMAREMLMNASPSPDEITQVGENTNNFFGTSIASAGDVNNDGYADVIVGAYGYALDSGGEAFIYFGGASMDSTPDVTMAGANIFGSSVSSAGDVNNDTYDDVIVGARGHSSNTGRAYIYYGGPGMDNTADVTMTGEATFNHFGFSVSSAGDVNNDTYDDVIVGARGYSSSTGRAYIYYGGSSMDNTADVTMTGEATSNHFGYSVSSAGDVNNDTYDDVIVGAYGYTSSTGRAYIYYGGSSMDNTADVTMTGGGSTNQFGISVASAGNVNGDAYDDVIVGANNYSSSTGRAYIYYGGSSMDNTADVTMTGESAITGFGVSVASAGDVNDDGYSDVIVGAVQYTSFTGRAYIFYGGSSMDTTADVTITGEAGSFFGLPVASAGDIDNDGYADVVIRAKNSANTGIVRLYRGGSSMDIAADVTMTSATTAENYFGQSVASAGDVNADGYDDIIVGANGYSDRTGRAYVYYGGSSMDTTADVTMTGEATSNLFGYSVSSAGDVNNDGYDDVIVGARGYSSLTGRAYIFYGGSSMDNTADVTMTGEATSNSFGYSVSSAGDVNNDTYDDVIVGAHNHTSSTGRAYIFYGGSSMNNTADVTMTGGTASSQFGFSVASAGDVNNDDYDDVIIGAAAYTSNTGRAYIFYGGSSMDNTVDVTMTGESTGNFFGVSVASAGDVNSDGYDDVIVGAYGYTTSTGRAYIYYGGSSMDTTADVTMTGGGTNNSFGISVAPLGDVNNDGYDDVIVGARQYSTSTGRAYVYYGGSSMDTTADVTMTGETTNNNFGISVASAGDVNGNGYDDIIVGAYWHDNTRGKMYIYLQGNVQPIDATADTTMTGETTTNSFGASVASAGDVNGDGYDDVIVGAYGYSTNTGRAYIYYGGTSGMDTTADVTMTGETTTNYFGGSVASAGDVNSDGYDDVIVGAYGYTTNTGRAYVFYGGSTMDTTADVTMTGGTTSDRFGTSVASAKDVNSDGYDDVIVGAYGYSTSTGRAYIYYGGSGMDNTADVTMTGVAGSAFGVSVASAGDVNGDGYADVVVGAYLYDSGFFDRGRADIFYGGASMNNTADVTMEGEAAAIYFGLSVAPAGDVNGDGYDDVIVGAFGYSSSTGRAYIFYGGSSMDNTADVTMTGGATSNNFGYSVASAGDVNSDGYDDVIVGASAYATNTGRAYIFYGGSSMDNTADVTMTGETTTNYFGTSVASAGDVNSDGYNDVIVGARGYSSNTGRTYTHFGGVDDAIPVFNLVQKHTTACSGESAVTATWRGESTTAASTNNLTLQVYRFGSTNAWETVTTNNTLAANTEDEITGSVTTNLSEYCDGSNWSYWRLQQASGMQNLKTDLFELAFTGVTNAAPDTPTSLTQIKVTGGATVVTGGWTNENQMKLTASATDPDASDTLELCVESKPVGTALDGTGEVCGSGVAYSGSAVAVEVTLTGISDEHYHWQARLKDAAGAYSGWLSYGGNAESARDFGVDTTAPTGTVYDGSTVSVDVIFNNGALDSLAANWTSNTDISGLSGYEYSIGTTAGGTTIRGWTTIGTDTSVTANSLSLVTSQTYFFNIRITDNATNTAVVSSNGQMVAPSLTFTKSTDTVDLGTLNASNSYTASQTLTLSVTTNAQNGYQIHGRATDFLKNHSLEILGMFSGGNYASPAAWGSGTGFGYHSSDTSVGGSNRFNSGTCLGGGSAPCFAPYATSGIGDVVADGNGPSAGGPEVDDDITITNKASIDAGAQEPGEYQTTVLYSAYATY